ncbi:hypothetical protein VD0002_g2127 [Verticillium dahliae]|uniref:PUM-HD domain-containing protein n=1 Tax=Verticillium dahliae TaxID=27337 RepID=A0AA45ARN8_VERDA|nr:NADPH:adrenodoxin oxidoreductase [Verticillium dahliae VDG2]PNH36178.1 hypothetical protein BJF96_g258 [Verticillium dahliae]PNH41206.1 hypothetical protein VD0004_g5879 [Verticillium dahliae]PNH67674.1 hypothetical protein VD0002_g2127 [Verticillium dahliae]PNH71851.1 hypothetical protein VD0001_g5689 [Verticillium dahliae]
MSDTSTEFSPSPARRPARFTAKGGLKPPDKNPRLHAKTALPSNQALPRTGPAIIVTSPPPPTNSTQDNIKPLSLTEQLLARLSEQEERFTQQRKALKDTSGSTDFYSRGLLKMASSNSLPVTPTVGENHAPNPTTRPASVDQKEAKSMDDEVARLKAELAQAHNKISCLDQELVQKREAAPMKLEVNTQKANFSAVDFVSRPSSANFRRGNGWNSPDVAYLGGGDAMNDNIGDRSRGGWSSSKTPWQVANYAIAEPSPMSNHVGGGVSLYNNTMDVNGSYRMLDNVQPERLAPEPDLYVRNHGGRRGNTNNIGGRYPSYSYGGNGYTQSNYATSSYANSNYAPSSYGGYSPTPNQFDPAIGHKSSVDVPLYPTYNPSNRTGLSPHALEFHSNTGWKDEATAAEGQTFLPTTEPMNYRRLLDKNASCDWSYIVDKIVCHNDQQASIFLQQKLKVGTPDQKYDIVEAIIAQAYALMVNRFGNFLVQRCFEHGTPEQVVKIAEAIRGHTLNLSMDPFGCHVVQKAFDAVPEEYKAIMVQELLRRIPETVIHRYACHVWQKLFELRWSETPPQIMKYVNESLRGMWHEVALGETGSLVVQNIFENCLEEDKRPCIEEVLINIDIVAHGQFGNWCIQHICEHGAPPDRSRAIDHVIRYASEYSTDQFASKVVEKCLKIGGPEFLGRYLDRVCEGRRDRPRIPLIDISSDQYGNYLVQYILTHAGPQHREMVQAHIRKHMVSLRGSKFGSRVGMLCTNPAVVTRPGPGVGPGMSRMGGGSGGHRGFGNPYR